jgi:acylphosphatase
MLDPVMEPVSERLDVTVSGRVQGVAFRWHTQRVAGELDLVGWVRNQPDGSVRLVAEGPRRQLEALLAWVRRGPDHARVEDCRHQWQQPTGQFDAFRIFG